MRSKLLKTLGACLALVILCWLTVPLWGVRGSVPPEIQLSQSPLLFDENQAYHAMRDFVTRNPRRPLGSLEAWQAAADLLSSLKRLGYDVRASDFDAVTAGHRQVGRNVLAFKAGGSPKILAVAAHYDTAGAAIQGASDDGAGVGTLLELARLFAQAPMRHSVLFILSDGEQWGMLGAADVAAHFPERDRIKAVLSLDGVSVGDLSAIKLEEDGLRGGFSPVWLRQIAEKAARGQGLPVRRPSGWQEWIQRSFGLASADQGPFLAAGIPAINLSSESTEEARAREIRLTEGDTIANIRPASMGSYGKVAERILRSLDSASVTPAADAAFCLRDDSFSSEQAIFVLQCVTFLPLLGMLAVLLLDNRHSCGPEKVLKEILFFVAWLAPFALAYSAILFCRLMRLIPRSSLYPAPPKDPLLYNVEWGVLAGIAAFCVVIGVGLHYLARYLTRKQPRSFNSSRLALSVILLVVAVLSVLHSSYWAVTFLAIPALIWPAMGRAQGAPARAACGVSILLAGVVMFAAALPSEHALNGVPHLVWYATLGLSNGMLRWQGFILASAATVVGLRFLSLHIVRPLE